jgi:hypothetical protein
MNKKPYPTDGFEMDVTYGRKLYCYLNKSKLAKYIKRKMNKRFRKQLKQINEDE